MRWISRWFGGKKDQREDPSPEHSGPPAEKPKPPAQPGPHPKPNPRVETRHEPVVDAATGASVAATTEPVEAGPVHSTPASGITDAQAAKDAVPLDWDVGDVILDIYEVKEIHEAGAMGRVYRMHHLDWDEEMAVKSPRAESFETEAQKQNFVRECLAWIGLGLHPQIVTCFYVRTLGGIPRVFAEYVTGGSLKDWIADRRLYDGGPEEALKRILGIAIQFAWGLEFAHRKGLIHQDVKPANVLMSEDGVAKVSDFGLANARAAVGEKREEDALRSFLGTYGGMTPAYCSPEQAEIAAQAKAGVQRVERAKLTRRTDIWSWAVSVLEMFTGEVTWGAGQAADLALNSYLESGSDDGMLRRMPEGLAALLRRCLRPSAEERPGHFGHVVDALMEIYRSSIGEEHPRPAPKPVEGLADTLSNEGISLIDLGLQEEAEQRFEAALKADPQHPLAIYNQGLHRWRTGRCTDQELLSRLEAASISGGDASFAEYLIGLVHIERGDAERAIVFLKRSGVHSSICVRVYRALWAVKSGLGRWGRCLRTFEQAVKCLVQCGSAVDAGIRVRNALVLAKSGLGRWGTGLRTFQGHTHTISSVAISADGRWALSGSWDQTLRLWEMATGKCLRTFEGHTGFVMSVAISPDGRWGLSGSTDETLHLWELSTGKCLRTFKGHTDGITSVAISPDGRWALSGGGREDALRLWELSTGKCPRTFEGHTDEITSVAISPDGRWALSGNRGLSSPPTLCRWELATGKCLRTFEGRGNDQTVAISPDGRWALSGGERDAVLQLLELSTGMCLRTFEGHTGGITSVAISPDGRWALSGSDDSTMRLWELSTGKCLRTFEDHTLRLRGLDAGRWFLETLGERRASVESVAISPDGRWGLSGCNDSALRLWELATGPVRDHEVARFRRIEEMAASAKSVSAALQTALSGLAEGCPEKALASLNAARAVQGHERSTEVMQASARLAKHCKSTAFRDCWFLRTFEGHTGAIAFVAISPDGRWALSGSRDKTLRQWELATGKCVRTYELCCFCVSPDWRCGLSVGGETLLLWELASGKCLQTLEGHTGYVTSVAISPDGRWALSGSRDKTLRLWELATGKCLRTLKGHTRDIVFVAISPDGRWGLSASWDKTLRLWELATGKCFRTFEGHWYSDYVESVAISPGGRWGVSGRKDGKLRLFELATGKCLRTFKGHTREITSVAISPDGRWALSGSDDSTLRLWELATGKCLRTLKGHVTGVTRVAISLDGRWALSGSWDNTLRLWQLDWDLDFPGWAEWDEGARPFLSNFLTMHTPYSGALPDGRIPTEEEICLALTRRGKPIWTEDDFKRLLHTLGCVGYGWLRPDGVKHKLEKMAANWHGPPPLEKTAG